MDKKEVPGVSNKEVIRTFHDFEVREAQTHDLDVSTKENNFPREKVRECGFSRSSVAPLAPPENVEDDSDLENARDVAQSDISLLSENSKPRNVEQISPVKDEPEKTSSDYPWSRSPKSARAELATLAEPASKKTGGRTFASDYPRGT